MSYCPRCWSALESSDDGCLCGDCGMFCDKNELIAKTGEYNPVQSLVQILKLHRSICRDELVLEQMVERGEGEASDLAKGAWMRAGSAQAIVELMTELLRIRGE